eukprot:1998288-Amphidinium_carterae.1
MQYLHPGGHVLTNRNHRGLALLVDDLTATESAKLLSEMCSAQWTSFILEDTEPDQRAGALLRRKIGEAVADMMGSTDDVETVTLARNRHLIWYAFRAHQMGASAHNVRQILRSGVIYQNGLTIKADITEMYNQTTKEIERLRCNEVFKDAVLKVYHIMPGLPYLPDALMSKLSAHSANARITSAREDFELQAFTRLLLIALHITRGSRTAGHFADAIFEFGL